MPNSLTVRQVAAAFASDGDVVLLAELDGYPVGVTHADDEGTLQHIFVLPQARDQGVAAALLAGLRDVFGQIHHDNRLSPAGATLMAAHGVPVLPYLRECPEPILADVAAATGRNLFGWVTDPDSLTKET